MAARYDDLRALFVNCTLKRSPERSHTEGLIDVSARHHGDAGRRVERDPRRRPRHRHRRVAGHDRARLGDRRVAGDSTSGCWPRTSSCIAGPIWLGDNSSVTKRVIERLYACSHLLNDAGQYAYYGRVGGCLITGNEDGVKHCAMNVLYSLQHLGYTIPPQADAGWIGEAGPGTVLPRPGLRRTGERLHQPQHHVHDVEPAAPGPDAARTPAASRRTATSAREWDAGCRFDFDNPEYR